MIKNIIIIILILLLIITLYSYYCLSNKMIDYQKIRMEHIINKENILNQRENKIKQISDCNNKLLNCNNAIKDIIRITNNIPLDHDYNPIYTEKINNELDNEIKLQVEEEQLEVKEEELENKKLNIMELIINPEDEIECESESEQFKINDIKKYFKDGVLNEEDCESEENFNITGKSTNKLMISGDNIKSANIKMSTKTNLE